MLLLVMYLTICIQYSTILSRILQNSGRLAIGQVSEGDNGVRNFDNRRITAIFSSGRENTQVDEFVKDLRDKVRDRWETSANCEE